MPLSWIWSLASCAVSRWLSSRIFFRSSDFDSMWLCSLFIYRPTVSFWKGLKSSLKRYKKILPSFKTNTILKKGFTLLSFPVSLYGGVCVCVFNQPTGLFELLWPQFPPNYPKHGLKWNFASLHTFRNFEKNHRFCSFAIGLHQIELVWPWKISNFTTEIFKNSQFFIYMDNIYIKWNLKTF